MHARMFGTEFRSPHIHVHVYTRQVLRRIYRCTTKSLAITLLAAMEVTRNRESYVDSCPPMLQLCGTTCTYTLYVQAIEGHGEIKVGEYGKVRGRATHYATIATCI